MRGAWVAQWVKPLPLAQVMISGSWDRVPHRALCSAGSLLPSLSLPASTSTCDFSLSNKYIKSLKCKLLFLLTSRIHTKEGVRVPLTKLKSELQLQTNISGFGSRKSIPRLCVRSPTGTLGSWDPASLGYEVALPRGLLRLLSLAL